MKLKQLAKKANEKKNKNVLSLVVGDNPTKACTESMNQQNTLNHAYSEILSSMSTSAQDHINLAEALSSQITESLKAVERRNDDYKKKQMQFYHTILAGRDKIYAERIKSKQKYDADCAEAEVHRQKQSVHDRHAERSARQYDLQRLDILNSKNVYILSTATANSVKTKFYTKDLPSLEDSFRERLPLHIIWLTVCRGVTDSSSDGFRRCYDRGPEYPIVTPRYLEGPSCNC